MDAAKPNDTTACFLCSKNVNLSSENEFLILVLQKNKLYNRLIFHTNCFFDAAGSEYKKALKYDLMIKLEEERIKYKDQ